MLFASLIDESKDLLQIVHIMNLQDLKFVFPVFISEFSSANIVDLVTCYFDLIVKIVFPIQL